MNSIKEQSLSGFKWSTIGQFSTLTIRFVLGLIIARLLMPEDYGAIGMLAIFMAIAQSFVECGFGNALIRKINRTEVDCSTAFYFNIVIGLLSYGVLFWAAPWIAIFYNMPVLKDVVRVFSLVIVINSLGIVPSALRTVAVDFKSQAIASILSAVISGIIGLAMAYHGYGVWALVWQSIISALLSVFIILILAKWVPAWKYSWRSFWEMFSYGSKLMLSGMLHTVYSQASTLLIGKFYTPAELGCYDRGKQIASFPSLNLSSVMLSVTFPILSKLQQDDERLIHVYHQYLAVISLVVFFLMTLLAVVAKPLILILLTTKWLGAVPFLQIFCLAFMFDSICRLNNNLIFVKGWSGLFLKLEIIKKAIVTPFFLLAIPFGAMAICCVAVVHTFVDILLSTYSLKKRLDIDLHRYGVLLRYLLVSALACAPSFLICHIEISPWISLSVGVVSATALYWWFLHKDENMKECVRILLNIIPVKRWMYRS